VKLIYITSTHPLYEELLNLRIITFFNEFYNARDLVLDVYESTALHVGCITSENQLVGCGRLHIDGAKAIISQMAVRDLFQKKGIGKLMLACLLEKSIKLKVHQVELSARVTALDFYKKMGFEGIGEIYPSKKTGILHLKMRKILIDN